ncbi:hypothetical protein Ddye_007303 [Dipteronia dyeriana]|uniref:Uncharacterized protein n=1 Tax=Dipteronia dyeriana TaxID=168575 RepID=A0AAD9XK58_9ROSI|nr:hypothetical protein Ddye_007303 [Dipteronia dyeriana]
MDAVTSVVEKLKGFGQSSQNFVNGLLNRRENSYSRNPIEILKRLQREAFSDLMKLRDRQDKVERMLSFYRTSKGSPFQESSTHIRGEVDALGAILLTGDIDEQYLEALDRAGIRTGIDARFAFETTLRQNDTLVAELVASEKGNGNLGDISGSPLSLAKLFYAANFTDWFSAIAIPVGAQCRDFGIPTDYTLQQRKGLSSISSLEPPLLNQHNGTAIGLTVKKSNFVASLAQSVSGIGTQMGSDGIAQLFSTFGQVICQLPKGVKLSLFGLHQVPKSLHHHVSFGSIAIPVGFLKQYEASERMVEAIAPPLGTNTQETFSTRSIALKLESEIIEGTKIGGWIEMKNSHSKPVRWAVTMYDSFEDEFGWGVSLSGLSEGFKGRDQYQFESFADLSLGKRFRLKPGVAYVVDGNAKILALMLRCNWSL